MILKEIRRFLPGDRLGVCTAGCDGHGLLVCFWYDKGVHHQDRYRSCCGWSPDWFPGSFSGRTDQRNGMHCWNTIIWSKGGISDWYPADGQSCVRCFGTPVFILVALILYTAMGCYPTVYTIQVDLLYVLYLCARARDHLYDQFGRCLFRDLTQVINIALQVGVWMTPIMWSMEDLGITGILASILKLNPMFYIVQGYRDAFIYKIWFWQRPGMTLYFWAFYSGVLADRHETVPEVKDTFCGCSVNLWGIEIYEWNGNSR